MIRASLVIPTYDRDEVLCDTIRYALNQDYPDYEIIVVDQTRTHDAKTKAFLENCPSRVRVIFREVPSLPGARNRGVLESRGEIVIMIDDDVIVNEDFVSQHVKYYDRPTIIGVAGRVEQEQRFTVKVPSLLKNEFLQWMTFYRFQGSVEQPAYRVAGGNFSFRRESGLRAGLFDENFVGDAWGEDYDFSLRLKDSGRDIIFAPDAAIFHLNAPSGGCAKRKRFSLSVVYSKFHNLAYLVEKNRLNGLYYLCLVPYVYWLVFMKKDYLSVKGLLFMMQGFAFSIRGFRDGFKKGRANVRYA